MAVYERRTDEIEAERWSGDPDDFGAMSSWMRGKGFTAGPSAAGVLGARDAKLYFNDANGNGVTVEPGGYVVWAGGRFFYHVPAGVFELIATWGGY